MPVDLHITLQSGIDDKEGALAMFNYKIAADLLAKRISHVSHAVSVYILVHDLFMNSMDNIAAAAGAWIVMQGFSFLLKSWSDSLPGP
ncbi:hypothetical protein [Acidithiobacillus ferriphilus]|nr:hypothetical protein [Acidithiobacillus ferriphilus]MEB8515446.1 hypothetical protein [Acidithiobacillus ferriphilus]